MTALPLRADRPGFAHIAQAPPPGAQAAPGPGEQMFADMAERWLRQPKDRRILALHLLRMPPPGARPHHLRVARMLFQDGAQRTGGQFVALPSHDLVLFCGAHIAQDDLPDSAEQLRQTLLRLFSADMPDPSRLVSFWRLDDDPEPFVDFAAGIAAQTAGPAPDGRAVLAEERPIPASALATLEDIVNVTPLIDVITQQTGMQLGSDRKQKPDARLAPSFRHIAISAAALHARAPAAADAMSDPFLRHHVMGRLHHRLLRLLEDDIRAEGRITRFSRRGGMPIHLGLSLETVLTPAFAHVSRLARNAGLQLGIEVGAMPASVAIDLLDHARSLLNMAGFQLIIGPFEAPALELIQSARLRPDLIKLHWQASLAEGGASAQQRLSAAIAKAGAMHFVLHGVDSEQAISWGLQHGIRLFQGPFLDRAQAATRMGNCPGAASCALRQCAARAGALGPGGRAGCTQPALLDSAELRVAAGQA
jgi:EAL domain-containing protein (putative c-di-GMP-specific phosphodiesterase class I)